MKKKVRDGQCHCSVCDQSCVGDANICFYEEEDSVNSGKSCKCNKGQLTGHASQINSWNNTI